MSLFRRYSERKKKNNLSSPVSNQFSSQVSKSKDISLEKSLDMVASASAVLATNHLGAKVSPKHIHCDLLVAEDFHPGDLGMILQSQNRYMKSSSLSKSLQQLLKQHKAISYLTLYMESQKASALIRFCLDAESFQATSWSRIRTHSLQSVGKSSLVTPRMEKEFSKPISRLFSHELPLNRDITSPDSVTSDDSAYHEAKSDTSEAISSSSDSNLLKSQNSGSHENIPDVRKCSSQACSSTSTMTFKTTHSSNVNSCPECVTVLSKDEEDTRTRDKCKRDECKMDEDKMTVIMCNNVHDNQSCPNNPKSGTSLVCDSDTTISYGDLAPSSTTCQNSSESSDFGTPGSSVVTLTWPSSNLAEKLKKRKICCDNGQVDPECFVECQKFAVNRIDQEYFKGFQSSVFHYKYQLEVLNSGKLNLTDILYNETALFYFMEYMEQEGLSHLLHFIIAADNFEDHLTSTHSYDGVQAQEDAMVLYDKYFSLQAAIPLGFPDSIRVEVEGNICREDGPLPDCFSKSRQIVLHTLETRYFQHFLTSDVFFKYRSEVMSAIQTAQDFPVGQRKRQGSDTSSEHSTGAHSLGSERISTRNTLLASGKSKFVELQKLDNNMKNLTLDPGLLNPDKLWERPDAGKMSIGKIDMLGQFVSSFGSDPDGNDTFKKSNAVSKFFKSKKDKEKEEEEMARKIAEQILNDVTSVTQAVCAIKKAEQPKK